MRLRNIPEALYAIVAIRSGNLFENNREESGMESASTTVISVGANAELVGLRNFVLQEAGFHVFSTLDEHEALARIERGECGVLLVCYSLAESVRRRLADALRKSCPISRMVLITNEHIDKPEFADFFVYGVEGPEALIDAVSAAVEKWRSAKA
jgi:vacuolar-type H+-ATPase subunit F/Vma7